MHQLNKVLVFGAGGYLGRHLIPVLASQENIFVTAVSSKPENLSSFSELDGRVQPICSTLDNFSLASACDHDLVINLACAGVAHKDEEDILSLSTNLLIAHRVSLLGQRTRKRLLLHFGSDTEQSHLAVYLNSSQGMSLPAEMVQPETSLYSLSKVIQSSIIRHYCTESRLYAHVVMTPNLYGGDDPPGSLLGSIRAAREAGLPFFIRRPNAVKRFIHIQPFSSYVIALLQDLLGRTDSDDNRQRFEVSSVDFVPRTTVGAFAKLHWSLLGGDSSSIHLGPSDSIVNER